MTFLILIWSLWTSSGRADTRITPQTAEDEKAKRDGTFWVIPAPFYQPETQIGVNLLGFKVFPYDGEKNSKNSSNILGYATFTQNSQFILSLTPTYYWDQGHNLLAGEMGFKSWPDHFYAIGNSSPDFYEKYSVQSLYLRPRFYREFMKDLSAGPFYEIQSDIITYVTPGGLLATGTIPGSTNDYQAGAGFGVRYDSRDIPFFPTEGEIIEASVTQFSGAFGSQVEYFRWTLDARKYLTLWPNYILALEIYGRSTAGNVPFETMSVLGGNQYMRGIYQGRFRDNVFLIGQSEFHFPIYKRFSGDIFADLGEVTPSMMSLDSSHTQATAGGGLRFLLDHQQQLNARLDLGMGPNSAGLYLAVGEAL